MIRQLAIENLAIIEHLDIHFEPGMSVVTGETGVGKSIIVNAVSLALGGRGKPQWIKPGSKRLSVTLDFDAGTKPRVGAWLAERQLDQEAGDCIVRRTMDQNGRSRASINSTPVTLAQLKSLGSLLIDISGQNQHQSLLLQERQRSILDARCNHADTLAAMRQACKQYHQAQTHITELENSEQKAAAQRECCATNTKKSKALRRKTVSMKLLKKNTAC